VKLSLICLFSSGVLLHQIVTAHQLAGETLNLVTIGKPAVRKALAKLVPEIHVNSFICLIIFYDLP